MGQTDPLPNFAVRYQINSNPAILLRMARVLSIHGIAQQLMGPDLLEAAWLPAIRSGMKLANARPIEGTDLRCAFYGDLFRKDPIRAAGYPMLRARDVTDEWDVRFLAELWHEASVHDSNVPPPDERVRASVPRSVQAALSALSKARFLTGLVERALIWNLKQVRLYLHDNAVREYVLSLLAKQVTSETSVVVGHSLGSIVAYEALCRHPEWQLKTLVTIGSPLGISNLIFHQLRPTPINNLGLWPNVEHWFNIAADGDVVALQKRLAICFGERVQDRLISNETRAHDATAYLTARQTGEAIASGLD
jgi:hypothetical protein